MNPASLEIPGRWRPFGLALVFGAVLLPALPLLVEAFHREPGSPLLGSGFSAALGRSLRLALAAAGAALAIGWPCGVLAGLFRFPLRRTLLVALLLPLVAPPFLWALGWAMFASSLGRGSVLDGLGGAALAFQGTAFPLVFFAAFAATRGLPAGPSDSARLAGGAGRLTSLTLRHAFGPALLAALLGAALCLADPGPGQVLGYEGAASQILISFSALDDYPLAARQCLAAALLAMAVVIPAAVRLAPRLARGLLSRDVRPAAPAAAPAGGWPIALTLATLAALLVLLPVIGLLGPLRWGFDSLRVGMDLARTWNHTACYGLLGAGIAVGLAAVAALCAGRSPKLGAALLGGMMLVLALPPSLGALGLVRLGSGSPAELDTLLRSRFTVALWLGLRLFPLAAIFLIRRVGEASPSWAPAAALHGMPMSRYLLQVLLPWLAPAVLIGGTAAALFAVADIHSAHLLHPPGRGSFPLSIFTVQANAPEATVASLCLAYLGGVAMLLGAGLGLGALWFRRTKTTK